MSNAKASQEKTASCKVKLGAFAYHETVKVGDISKEISTKRKYFLTPPSRSQYNLASPHIFPDPPPPHPRDDQFSPVILDVETERQLGESTNTFKGEFLLPTRPSSLSLFFFIFAFKMATTINVPLSFREKTPALQAKFCPNKLLNNNCGRQEEPAILISRGRLLEAWLALTVG